MNTSEPLSTSQLAIVAPGREALQGEEEGYPEKEFERIVPFSDFIVQVPPSKIEPDYLAAGLAAAFTTSIDNPVFKLPTRHDERNGAIPAAFAMYAPYYVGTGFSPEQIANDVATRAALYLKWLDAEHGHDGYVGRLLSVLRRGRVSHRGPQAIEDRNILFDVHDFMSVITNRLRHLVPFTLVGGKLYSPAEAYRAETHEKVDPYVETVAYGVAPGGFRQQYELPEFIRSDPSQLVALGWDYFDTRALRRGAEFAALAAEKIGDPLVRGSLSEHYIPPHIRSREYLFATH